MPLGFFVSPISATYMCLPRRGHGHRLLNATIHRPRVIHEPERVIHTCEHKS